MISYFLYKSSSLITLRCLTCKNTVMCLNFSLQLVLLPSVQCLFPHTVMSGIYHTVTSSHSFLLKGVKHKLPKSLIF